MPYLELEEGGFLGLETYGGVLLLAEASPVAANESILYQTDRIEAAFVEIMQAALPSGVQVLKKRDRELDQTPRVEYVLTIQQNQTQRYIRYPDNSFAPAQPLNAWNYQLQTTVVTNRSKSDFLHNTIVGIVRWSLQYASLLNTWTTEIAPYHAITSCQETATDNAVENDGDLDMQRLSFIGMCNIRDTAWPAL